MMSLLSREGARVRSPRGDRDGRGVAILLLCRVRPCRHPELDGDAVALLDVLECRRREVQLHPPFGRLHVYPALFRVHLGDLTRPSCGARLTPADSCPVEPAP